MGFKLSTVATRGLGAEKGAQARTGAGPCQGGDRDRLNAAQRNPNQPPRRLPATQATPIACRVLDRALKDPAPGRSAELRIELWIDQGPSRIGETMKPRHRARRRRPTPRRQAGGPTWPVGPPLTQAMTERARRRRSAPIAPKPRSIIVQVAGSGTAASP